LEVLTYGGGRPGPGAQCAGPGGRSRLARIARALPILVALLLLGCGPVSPASDPARSVASTGPATVALRYARALFAGHFAAASRYVAPASRNSFLVLTDGLRSASIAGHHLAVGSTKVRGSAAIAVLTGTICSSGSVAPLPLPGSGVSAREDCVTNTDRHSTSPIFTVDLSRGPDDQWLIVFLVPPGSRSPGPAPSVEQSSSAPPS
jgi:hypothetical protein